MKLRHYDLFVPVVGCLLVAGSLFFRSTATPSGQPAFADLTETAVADMKSQFNAATESTRIILLISPSCPFCLKGASTVDGILKKYGGRPIAVFAVWQPILPTDWGKPGTSVSSRISDPRVSQYWDAEHRVAAALKAAAERGGLEPSCCFRSGTWWDLMAVYPPGGKWQEKLPQPALLEGTIDDAAPALEALLAKGP